MIYHNQCCLWLVAVEDCDVVKLAYHLQNRLFDGECSYEVILDLLE